ncbi:MAG: hypothetical protein WD396_09255, partial [Pseudohongiellaceae bacterium]
MPPFFFGSSAEFMGSQKRHFLSPSRQERQGFSGSLRARFQAPVSIGFLGVFASWREQKIDPEKI